MVRGIWNTGLHAIWSNIHNYRTDPLWEVIGDGGPFHCRGYLANYCTRLEETGRADLAVRLKSEHPQEYSVSY